MSDDHRAVPEGEGDPQYDSEYWGLAALPMRAWQPVVAGAVAGLLLRFVFSGEAGSPWSAMAGWFVFLTPLVVGMVTVYLAERRYRRAWSYYFIAPFIATMLFVAGTLLIMIEGLICAIIIVPMFAVLGALGGLMMGLVCRLTRWPKHTLYGVSALPLVLAMLGSNIPTPTGIGSIERSLLVRAPADVVWANLNDIQRIRSSEMDSALARKIGVPMPKSGTTRLTSQGRVRESRWGSHVHFDEVMQAWEPERYMRFTYRFSPDSFPRAALDDHVVIGGHYFDLLDTEYILVSAGNTTHLTTRVRYRISTHFNFYADWVAQLLLANLSEVGLQLYASRSEQNWEARTSARTSHATHRAPDLEAEHGP